MFINIEDIKGEPLVVEFEEAAGEFPELLELTASGECKFQGPIKTHLSMVRIESMVEVEGRVEVDALLACSRCLDEFAAKISGSFSLTFARELPEVDTDEDEIEISAEEMGLILYSDDRIDLREAVQQEVVMALPLRPLCDSRCKGLCPQCGANLNKEHCDCRKNDFSIKFSALKDFKVDKD